MVATAHSCTRSRGLRLFSQLFINKRTQMEYISHEDYKSFMSKFQAETPKGLLKEDLEQEGNAFTAGLAKAKKGQEFKVDGKSVKDTSNYDASMEEGVCPGCGMPSDKCQCGEEMSESGHGDEPYDFNKAAIESASGDKISHTEEDDYGRTIYWGTKNPNVTYYIGSDEQIIKYDGETGERHSIGDLRHYDDPDFDFGIDGGEDTPAPDHDYSDDFNDGEFWEAEVKKLKNIAGLNEDLEFDGDDEEREARAKKAEMDDEEAENAERDLDEEEGKLNLRAPSQAAKNIAKKYGAELKPEYDEYQRSFEEYMQAIRKYKNKTTDPEFREIATAHNKLVKDYQNKVLGLARQEMEDSGEKPVVARNLAYGYSDEDWPSEFVTDLAQEMKGMAEGLNFPTKQATGQTIIANEDQAPFGFSVLSPDERKQLKEYINSYKTIKKEIANLLEKAGKSGKIMEGMADAENVPAARKATYKDPTTVPTHHKKSNLGGNRTGLVMTKAEMWENEEGEHESIEAALGEKLHQTFNKVTQMALKQIVADGWDEDQAVSFLQMEIEEHAKEATMSQYDPH